MGCIGYWMEIRIGVQVMLRISCVLEISYLTVPASLGSL